VRAQFIDNSTHASITAVRSSVRPCRLPARFSSVYRDAVRQQIHLRTAIVTLRYTHARRLTGESVRLSATGQLFNVPRETAADRQTVNPPRFVSVCVSLSVSLWVRSANGHARTPIHTDNDDSLVVCEGGRSDAYSACDRSVCVCANNVK